VKRKKPHNKQVALNSSQPHENNATTSIPPLNSAPSVNPSSNPFELLGEDLPSPCSPPQVNALAIIPPPSIYSRPNTNKKQSKRKQSSMGVAKKSRKEIQQRNKG